MRLVSGGKNPLEYTSSEKRTLNGSLTPTLLYLVISLAYYSFEPYLQFANQDTFYDEITFYLLFAYCSEWNFLLLCTLFA